MQESQHVGDQIMSRAPHGARGLKFRLVLSLLSIMLIGRAPHGARGLKFALGKWFCILMRVAPRMGRVD